MRRSPQPDPRPATAAEHDHATSINPYLARWYPLWIDAGFTPHEVEQWWPVTNALTMLPNIALRLRNVGWQPADVAAFLAAPTLVIDLGDLSVFVNATGGQVLSLRDGDSGRLDPFRFPTPDHQAHLPTAASIAVLSAFVADVCASRAGIALDVRDTAVVGLHDAGWTQQTIADHLGLTKQRVSAIIKAQAGRGRDALSRSKQDAA